MSTIEISKNDIELIKKVFDKIDIPLYKKLASYDRREKQFGSCYWTLTRDGQTSYTAGLNLNRAFGAWPGVHTFSKQYVEVQRALTIIMNKYLPNFHYTSIQVNKNYPGYLHTDNWNVGESVMLTFGNTEGGELWYNGEIYETRDHLMLFNGNLPHMTLPYKGTRYSLVMFTTKVWTSALRKNPQVFLKLQTIGIPANPKNLKRHDKFRSGKLTKKELLQRAAATIREQVRSGTLNQDALTLIDRKKA